LLGLHPVGIIVLMYIGYTVRHKREHLEEIVITHTIIDQNK